MNSVTYFRHATVTTVSIALLAAACGGRSNDAVSTSCETAPCTSPDASSDAVAFDAVMLDGPADATGSADDASAATDAPGDDARAVDAAAPPWDADASSVQDDPCLPSTDYTFEADCSATCGGPLGCTRATCDSDSGTPSLIFTSWQDFPFLLRTPSHPKPSACLASCNQAQLNALFVAANLPTQAGTPGIMITVPPPWHVASTTSQLCPGPAVHDNCAIYPAYGGGYITIFTTDPNAPARNVLITPSATNQACPDQ